MELNHLNYFYEVAKSGSFTAAANRLRISQSALSKAVALLEDRQGVKLFDRSKKGVALTEIGREIFAKCEGVFNGITDIELTCRGIRPTCEGSLRFAASDHVTNYLLLRVAQTMRAQFPKVIPSIFSGTPNDIVALILSNEIEFGLFFTKLNIPGVRYETVTELEMAVVCSPELAKGEGLKKVLQKSGLISSIQAQYQNHPSQSLINVIGKNPNIAFEANTQETQKRLCLAGAGVAYLTRFMVEEEIKSGALTEFRLKEPLRLQLLLARRKDRDLSLSAKTFLGLLAQPVKP